MHYLGRKNNDADVDITINKITVGSLSYSSETLDATVKTPISQLTPSITPTGATGSYSANSLPDGLSIASDTGIISGTPTTIVASNTYTVTFTASGNYTGTPTKDITIAVNAKAINSIEYEVITGTVGTAITEVSPTKVPAEATGTFAVAVEASLPEWTAVSIETTGKISGTPTVAATTGKAVSVTIEMTGYWRLLCRRTVTATNSISLYIMRQPELPACTVH